MAQGLWNIGGFNLPDFGISEALGIGPRNAAITNPNSGALSTNSTINVGGKQVPVYQQPQNTSSAPTGGGGSTPSSVQQVQGIQTQNLNNAQNNVDRQAEALRNQIGSGFDSIFGQLDQQAGLLPGWQQQDENTIENTVGGLRSGIQTGLDNANKSLDLDRQQIQTGVNKSVTDIQNNLRSLLKNAQGVVGAYGAGSSSITNSALPYAFSKMFAQQRGNIQGQANSQFVDLDKKALDVQTTFSQQKSQIDQWEQSQLQATRDKYHSMLSDISNARINATGQKAQALQGLQMNLLQQAQNDLNNIKAEAANTRQSIQQWALQRSNDLAGLQSSLQQAGTYNPTAITYNPLGGLQGGQNASQSLNFFNPYAINQKKDDQASQF